MDKMIVLTQDFFYLKIYFLFMYILSNMLVISNLVVQKCDTYLCIVLSKFDFLNNLCTITE